MSQAIESLTHIAISAWPIFLIILIVLIMGVIKFFRSIFPTKAEKEALKIASDKTSDVLNIPLNYSFRDDKINILEQSISKLSGKREENNSKIAILKFGLRKLGIFSKTKRGKIELKISLLKKANDTISNQINTANNLIFYMRRFNVLKNANIGDVVQFGKYSWLAMKREGTSLLLLSLKALDASYDNNGWANGSLRYCCQSLYSEFDTIEKHLIKPTENKTKNENIITLDQIFVLSPEQVEDMPNVCWKSLQFVEKGNSIDAYDVNINWKMAEWNEKAENTLRDYIYDYSEGYGGRLERSYKNINFDKGWWLRSADGETAYVNPRGKLIKYNAIDGIKICGFRPALWVEV